MTQQSFDINSFGDIERYLREIHREAGRLAEEDMRLYERIDSRTRATGPETAFGAPSEIYGTIIADHGLIGGGTLPPVVVLAQRGEIWSGVFVGNEIHGDFGSIYVQESSVLAESAISL